MIYQKIEENILSLIYSKFNNPLHKNIINEKDLVSMDNS